MKFVPGSTVSSANLDFDNAVAESLFGSLKTELIYRHTSAGRHDAELAIFPWVETSTNRRFQVAPLPPNHDQG